MFIKNSELIYKIIRRLKEINDKNINTGKSDTENYQLVVTTDPKNGEVLAWTHFDANDKYRDKLYEKEKQIIQIRGLKDKDNNNVDVNYDEYLNLNRILPTYLGGGITGQVQRSQATSLLKDENIQDEIKNKEKIL